MLPVLVFDAIHVPAPTGQAHEQQAYADDTRFRPVKAFGGVADLVPASEFWRR
jgi:hypothetical protein